MNFIFKNFVVIGFILSGLSEANAATYHVDDSATILSEPQVKMRWRNNGFSRGTVNIIDGSTIATIRLNTSPWINKYGQIYMVLPPQPIGQVVVDWTTQGRLLSGSLISSNRTLVYSGPILSPIIEDTINIQIHSDGTKLTSIQKLNFHFEIDIN
jgi:hypothetical protein